MILNDDCEVSEYISHSLIQTSCSSQPGPKDRIYSRSDVIKRSISCFAVLEALYHWYGKSLFAVALPMGSLFQSVPETGCGRGSVTLASIMKVPLL